MPHPSTRLILLDRDGVINVDRPESVLAPEEFVLLPNICGAIARLSQAGFALAICTNQSAVGKGLLPQATLDAIHAQLKAEVAAAGGRIDAIYVAPDHPDFATQRRKPGAGMLEEALADFGAQASHTPFLGDALRDLQAAEAAGCIPMLVRTGKGAALEAAGLPVPFQGIAVFDDLADAVDVLIAHFGVE